MRTFQQLVPVVGEWSQKNFGGQETPYLTVAHAGSVRPNLPRGKGGGGLSVPGDFCVWLGSLAPLLGIGEELGELAEAASEADVEDAVGDVAVYLCDYCHREGCRPGRYDPRADKGGTMADPMAGLVACYGGLCHATLKRHQRIRGYHDRRHYEDTRDAIVPRFWYYLDVYSLASCGQNATTVLNTVWHKVVRKRDWREDAGHGGGAG